MDVILLADRKGQELLPLTDNTCVPLLPIAGKMVIEHTLEALVEAGFREAHIILSPFAEQVKEALGNGERWGMRLTFGTSRGEESAAELLSRLPHAPLSPFLILRGDVVRSSRIKDFLQQAESLTTSCLPALFEGKNAFLMLCNDASAVALDALNWPDTLPEATTDSAIDIKAQVAALDSLAAYHQANLDAASGRLGPLLIPGHQTALGLTQGRNTEAYPQNIKQGIALIGSNCHLHPSVELSGEVVIGDNVIIDRQASIESAVILPHTYIGELVELRNAIVRGNDLIRVDNGTTLKISDSFLLADLKTTTFNKGIGTVFNRIAGVLLLVISLPLWILALLLSLLQHPQQLFITRQLRGNKIDLNDFGIPERTEFSAREWNVSVPVLRYLPRILAVISGDISLVGTLPVSLETASIRSEEWEKLADQAPAGLIGPTQMLIPIDASDDEKLMSDSFYAAHFNARQDLRYIFQSFRVLVSRKAWFS